METPHEFKVERFPKVVPMEKKFFGVDFYVRDCYDEYHTRVLALLKGPIAYALEEAMAELEEEEEEEEELEKKKQVRAKIEELKEERAEIEDAQEPRPGEKHGVTIAGTPGIGKSVFMGYFYDRYRKEHPDVTIIMSSYNRKSVLKKVVITRGGKTVASVEKNVAAMQEAISVQLTAAKASGGFIELLDGPPDDVPSSYPWVSFTSPNANWKALIRKDKDFIATLYMPVWTLDELNDAAIQLQRGDLMKHLDAESNDEESRLLREVFPNHDMQTKTRLEYRFSTFGGVARPCFLKAFDDLKQEYTELQTAIASMSVEDMFRSVVVQAPPQTIYRLLHYVPTPKEPRSYTAVVASTTVAVQFLELERELTAETRGRVLHLVRGISEAAALVAFLLEAQVYRQLKAGGTLEVTKLCGAGVSKLMVKLPPVAEFHHITKRLGVSPFDVAQPQRAIPVCQNLEAINGFYWSPEGKDGHFSLLLFRVAVSIYHRVEAEDCVQVLKALGMWETVKTQAKPTVALVFGVPGLNKDKFGQQEVLPPSVNGKREIVVLADDAPLVNVWSIGHWDIAALNAIEIGTVGELRTAAANLKKRKRDERDLIMKSKASLETHQMKATANNEEVQVVQRIPQYMWTI